MNLADNPDQTRIPVALTIAGSDPSGGAGLQADLKTFHQHQVYGMSVVTLLTVQNTQTVSAVKLLSGDFVLQQLDACLSDIPPAAAKTGALGSVEVIEAVADRARSFSFPLVVDPVMISKHLVPLMDSKAAEVMVRKLLPGCFLITPNLPEASSIVGYQVDSLEKMRKAALAIEQLGPQHVFIKGGHLEGVATDLLLSAGTFHEFRSERIDTRHTHGTGCTTSAAITACLARGDSLIQAVSNAKKFITEAIRTNPGLGNGFGPVNFFAESQSKTRSQV